MIVSEMLGDIVSPKGAIPIFSMDAATVPNLEKGMLSVNCFLRSSQARACLENHSCQLHAPLCGIFGPHSVNVAHYASLIRVKSPTNCDAHLTESIFQTRSRACLKIHSRDLHSPLRG